MTSDETGGAMTRNAGKTSSEQILAAVEELREKELVDIATRLTLLESRVQEILWRMPRMADVPPFKAPPSVSRADPPRFRHPESQTRAG